MILSPFYAIGSLCLTFALIACGISFFCPFWLYNLSVGSDVTSPDTTYGLWALCVQGQPKCQWFWENGYLVQNFFTTNKWGLATQILYFIGAALVLFCVIFGHLHLCCSRIRCITITLGGVLIFACVCQVAAMATWGAGNRYQLGTSAKSFDIMVDSGPYFGWGYWMTVPGAALTLLAGIFFLLSECCDRDKIRNY